MHEVLILARARGLGKGEGGRRGEANTVAQVFDKRLQCAFGAVVPVRVVRLPGQVGAHVRMPPRATGGGNKNEAVHH